MLSLNPSSNTYDTIESSIQSVTSQILPSNILAIAAKCREILATEYSSKPTWNTLENTKILHDYSEHNLLANIEALISATSLSDSQSTLIQELKVKVHETAHEKFKATSNLTELINLSCALTYITPKTKKTVLPAIFLEIRDKLIAYNGFFDVDNSVLALFALRKMKKTFFRDKLFKHLCCTLSSQVTSLTPLQVSLVAKGLVQASHIDSKLFGALRDRAIDQKENFTPNEIVNTLWAYCYADWKKEEDPSITRQLNMAMIDAFRFPLINRMDELYMGQAVRIAWTFKNMNLTDKDFFQSVKASIEKKLDTLSPASFEMIIKILCQIKDIGDDLLIKMLSIISDKSKDNCYFTAEVLSTITYYVLMKFCKNDENVASYEKFIAEALKIIAIMNHLEWTNDSLMQLNTITTIYEAKGHTVDNQLISRLGILLKAIRQLKQKNAKPSYFHKNVHYHLNRLLGNKNRDLTFTDEYLFEHNFSIDIACTKIKLAIEVDGHCHFDEQGSYMSKNIIKETLLAIKKWNLVRITYKEWSEMSDDQKVLLLEEKLSPYLTL